MLRNVKAHFRNLWKMKKALASLSVSLIYFYSNVLASHAAEANFWSERREAAQKRASLSQTLPALDLAAERPNPSGLSDEQYKMLAQLPTATNFDFGVSENISVGPVAGNEPRVNLPADALKRLKEGVRAKPENAPSWLSTLLLPYGSIRDIYVSRQTGAPLIIHIQDAHGIKEAQQNIAAMIQSLRQERGVSLVGVEGAAGEFALEPYRAFSEPEIVRDLADHFLEVGDINAAEYVGLTAPQPPVLWGVEDQSLYEGNIQAFKDSVKNRGALEHFLADAERAAARLKEQAYSSDLKEFDKHFSAYRSHREGLGQYIRYLVSADADGGMGHHNIHLLQNALQWEEMLDFKAVEKERMELVEVMARRLSEAQLSALIQRSLFYRMGRMGYGDYYRFLRELCAQGGIDLGRFSQLSSYITYVLLAERIDRNMLLSELDKLEAEVQRELARTPEQVRLAAVGRRLLLLEKLVRNNMTPLDWLTYDRNREFVLRAADELRDLAAALGQAADVRAPQDLAALLKPSEDFCLIAGRRNKALVDNILAKTQQQGATSAILVTGGFHSDGLTELLRAREISYVVVTPKIDEVPKENNYLDVFARDPLPLEKVFQGEKIYLAAPSLMASNNLGTFAARVNGLQSKFIVFMTLLILRARNVITSDQRRDVFAASRQAARQFSTIDDAEFDEATKGALNAVMTHRETGRTVRFGAALVEEQRLNLMKASLKKAGLLRERKVDGANEGNWVEIPFRGQDGQDLVWIVYQTTSFFDTALRLSKVSPSAWFRGQVRKLGQKLPSFQSMGLSRKVLIPSVAAWIFLVAAAWVTTGEASFVGLLLFVSPALRQIRRAGRPGAEGAKDDGLSREDREKAEKAVFDSLVEKAKNGEDIADSAMSFYEILAARREGERLRGLVEEVRRNAGETGAEAALNQTSKALSGVLLARFERTVLAAREYQNALDDREKSRETDTLKGRLERERDGLRDTLTNLSLEASLVEKVLELAEDAPSLDDLALLKNAGDLFNRAAGQILEKIAGPQNAAFDLISRTLGEMAESHRFQLDGVQRFAVRQLVGGQKTPQVIQIPTGYGKTHVVAASAFIAAIQEKSGAGRGVMVIPGAEKEMEDARLLAMIAGPLLENGIGVYIQEGEERVGYRLTYRDGRIHEEKTDAAILADADVVATNLDALIHRYNEEKDIQNRGPRTLLSRPWRQPLIDEAHRLVDRLASPWIISGGQNNLLPDYEARVALQKLAERFINRPERLNRFGAWNKDSRRRSRDLWYRVEDQWAFVTNAPKAVAQLIAFIEQDDAVQNKEEVLKLAGSNGLNFLELAITAREAYRENVDYVVLNERGEVMTAGGETGTPTTVVPLSQRGAQQKGMQLGNGVHQAIETKYVERGMRVTPPSMTQQQTGIRNFLSNKDLFPDGWAGVTATAPERAFKQVFGAEVQDPPNVRANKTRQVRNPGVFKIGERRTQVLADRAEELIDSMEDGRRPSAIIALQNPEELDRFEEILRSRGIENVGVLGDKTQDKEAVIGRAGEAGRLTLILLSHAEGIDYKGVDYVIAGFAMGDKERRQLMGRVSRRQGGGKVWAYAPGVFEEYLALDDPFFTRNKTALQQVIFTLRWGARFFPAWSARLMEKARRQVDDQHVEAGKRQNDVDQEMDAYIGRLQLLAEKEESPDRKAALARALSEFITQSGEMRFQVSQMSRQRRVTSQFAQVDSRSLVRAQIHQVYIRALENNDLGDLAGPSGFFRHARGLFMLVALTGLGVFMAMRGFQQDILTATQGAFVWLAEFPPITLALAVVITLLLLTALLPRVNQLAANEKTNLQVMSVAMGAGTEGAGIFRQTFQVVRYALNYALRMTAMISPAMAFVLLMSTVANPEMAVPLLNVMVAPLPTAVLMGAVGAFAAVLYLALNWRQYKSRAAAKPRGKIQQTASSAIRSVVLMLSTLSFVVFAHNQEALIAAEIAFAVAFFLAASLSVILRNRAGQTEYRSPFLVVGGWLLGLPAFGALFAATLFLGGATGLLTVGLGFMAFFFLTRLAGKHAMAKEYAQRAGLSRIATWFRVILAGAPDLAIGGASLFGVAGVLLSWLSVEFSGFGLPAWIFASQWSALAVAVLAAYPLMWGLVRIMKLLDRVLPAQQQQNFALVTGAAMAVAAPMSSLTQPAQYESASSMDQMLSAFQSGNMAGLQGMDAGTQAAGLEKSDWYDRANSTLDGVFGGGESGGSGVRFTLASFGTLMAGGGNNNPSADPTTQPGAASPSPAATKKPTTVPSTPAAPGTSSPGTGTTTAPTTPAKAVQPKPQVTFTASDLSIKTGQKVDFSAAIRNTGTETRDFAFVVRDNGKEAKRVSVSIPAGGQKTVEIPWTSPQQAGDHKMHLAIVEDGKEVGGKDVTVDVALDPQVEVDKFLGQLKSRPNFLGYFNRDSGLNIGANDTYATLSPSTQGALTDLVFSSGGTEALFSTYNKINQIRDLASANAPAFQVLFGFAPPGSDAAAFDRFSPIVTGSGYSFSTIQKAVSLIETFNSQGRMGDFFTMDYGFSIKYGSTLDPGQRKMVFNLAATGNSLDIYRKMDRLYESSSNHPQAFKLLFGSLQDPARDKAAFVQFFKIVTDSGYSQEGVEKTFTFVETLNSQSRMESFFSTQNGFSVKYGSTLSAAQQQKVFDLAHTDNLLGVYKEIDQLYGLSAKHPQAFQVLIGSSADPATNKAAFDRFFGMVTASGYNLSSVEKTLNFIEQVNAQGLTDMFAMINGFSIKYGSTLTADQRQIVFDRALGPGNAVEEMRNTNRNLENLRSALKRHGAEGAFQSIYGFSASSNDPAHFKILMTIVHPRGGNFNADNFAEGLKRIVTLRDFLRNDDAARRNFQLAYPGVNATSPTPADLEKLFSIVYSLPEGMTFQEFLKFLHDGETTRRKVDPVTGLVTWETYNIIGQLIRIETADLKTIINPSDKSAITFDKRTGAVVSETKFTSANVKVETFYAFRYVDPNNPSVVKEPGLIMYSLESTVNGSGKPQQVTYKNEKGEAVYRETVQYGSNGYETGRQRFVKDPATGDFTKLSRTTSGYRWENGVLTRTVTDHVSGDVFTERVDGLGRTISEERKVPGTDLVLKTEIDYVGASHVRREARSFVNGQLKNTSVYGEPVLRSDPGRQVATGTPGHLDAGLPTGTTIGDILQPVTVKPEGFGNDTTEYYGMNDPLGRVQMTVLSNGNKVFVDEWKEGTNVALKSHMEDASGRWLEITVTDPTPVKENGMTFNKAMKFTVSPFAPNQGKNASGKDVASVETRKYLAGTSILYSASDGRYETFYDIRSLYESPLRTVDTYGMEGVALSQGGTSYKHVVKIYTKQVVNQNGERVLQNTEIDLRGIDHRKLTLTTMDGNGTILSQENGQLVIPTKVKMSSEEILKALSDQIAKGGREKTYTRRIDVSYEQGYFVPQVGPNNQQAMWFVAGDPASAPPGAWVVNQGGARIFQTGRQETVTSPADESYLSSIKDPFVLRTSENPVLYQGGYQGMGDVPFPWTIEWDVATYNAGHGAGSSGRQGGGPVRPIPQNLSYTSDWVFDPQGHLILTKDDKPDSHSERPDTDEGVTYYMPEMLPPDAYAPLAPGGQIDISGMPAGKTGAKTAFGYDALYFYMNGAGTADLSNFQLVITDKNGKKLTVTPEGIMDPEKGLIPFHHPVPTNPQYSPDKVNPERRSTIVGPQQTLMTNGLWMVSTADLVDAGLDAGAIQSIQAEGLPSGISVSQAGVVGDGSLTAEDYKRAEKVKQTQLTVDPVNGFVTHHVKAEVFLPSPYPIPGAGSMVEAEFTHTYLPNGLVAVEYGRRTGDRTNPVIVIMDYSRVDGPKPLFAMTPDGHLIEVYETTYNGGTTNYVIPVEAFGPRAETTNQSLAGEAHFILQYLGEDYSVELPYPTGPLGPTVSGVSGNFFVQLWGKMKGWVGLETKEGPDLNPLVAGYSAQKKKELIDNASNLATLFVNRGDTSLPWSAGPPASVASPGVNADNLLKYKDGNLLIPTAPGTRGQEYANTTEEGDLIRTLIAAGKWKEAEELIGFYMEASRKDGQAGGQFIMDSYNIRIGDGRAYDAQFDRPGPATVSSSSQISIINAALALYAATPDTPENKGKRAELYLFIMNLTEKTLTEFRNEDNLGGIAEFPVTADTANLQSATRETYQLDTNARGHMTLRAVLELARKQGDGKAQGFETALSYHGDWMQKNFVEYARENGVLPAAIFRVSNSTSGGGNYVYSAETVSSAQGWLWFLLMLNQMEGQGGIKAEERREWFDNLVRAHSAKRDDHWGLDAGMGLREEGRLIFLQETALLLYIARGFGYTDAAAPLQNELAAMLAEHGGELPQIIGAAPSGAGDTIIDGAGRPVYARSDGKAWGTDPVAMAYLLMAMQSSGGAGPPLFAGTTSPLGVKFAPGSRIFGPLVTTDFNAWAAEVMRTPVFWLPIGFLGMMAAMTFLSNITWRIGTLRRERRRTTGGELYEEADVDEAQRRLSEIVFRFEKRPGMESTYSSDGPMEQRFSAVLTNDIYPVIIAWARRGGPDRQDWVRGMDEFTFMVGVFIRAVVAQGKKDGKDTEDGNLFPERVERFLGEVRGRLRAHVEAGNDRKVEEILSELGVNPRFDDFDPDVFDMKSVKDATGPDAGLTDAARLWLDADAADRFMSQYKKFKRAEGIELHPFHPYALLFARYLPLMLMTMLGIAFYHNDFVLPDAISLTAFTQSFVTSWASSIQIIGMVFAAAVVLFLLSNWLRNYGRWKREDGVPEGVGGVRNLIMQGTHAISVALRIFALVLVIAGIESVIPGIFSAFGTDKTLLLRVVQGAALLELVGLVLPLFNNSLLRLFPGLFKGLNMIYVRPVSIIWMTLRYYFLRLTAPFGSGFGNTLRSVLTYSVVMLLAYGLGVFLGVGTYGWFEQYMVDNTGRFAAGSLLGLDVLYLQSVAIWFLILAAVGFVKNIFMAKPSAVMRNGLFLLAFVQFFADSIPPALMVGYAVGIGLSFFLHAFRDVSRRYSVAKATRRALANPEKLGIVFQSGESISSPVFYKGGNAESATELLMKYWEELTRHGNAPGQRLTKALRRAHGLRPETDLEELTEWFRLMHEAEERSGVTLWNPWQLSGAGDPDVMIQYGSEEDRDKIFRAWHIRNMLIHMFATTGQSMDSGVNMVDNAMALAQRGLGDKVAIILAMNHYNPDHPLPSDWMGHAQYADEVEQRDRLARVIMGATGVKAVSVQNTTQNANKSAAMGFLDFLSSVQINGESLDLDSLLVYDRMFTTKDPDFVFNIIFSLAYPIPNMPTRRSNVNVTNKVSGSSENVESGATHGNLDAQEAAMGAPAVTSHGWGNFPKLLGRKLMLAGGARSTRFAATSSGQRALNGWWGGWGANALGQYTFPTSPTAISEDLATAMQASVATYGLPIPRWLRSSGLMTFREKFMGHIPQMKLTPFGQWGATRNKESRMIAELATPRDRWPAGAMQIDMHPTLQRSFYFGPVNPFATELRALDGTFFQSAIFAQILMIAIVPAIMFDLLPFKGALIIFAVVGAICTQILKALGWNFLIKAKGWLQGTATWIFAFLSDLISFSQQDTQHAQAQAGRATQIFNTSKFGAADRLGLDMRRHVGWPNLALFLARAFFYMARIAAVGLVVPMLIPRVRKFFAEDPAFYQSGLKDRNYTVYTSLSNPRATWLISILIVLAALAALPRLDFQNVLLLYPVLVVMSMRVVTPFVGNIKLGRNLGPRELLYGLTGVLVAVAFLGALTYTVRATILSEHFLLIFAASLLTLLLMTKRGPFSLLFGWSKSQEDSAAAKTALLIWRIGWGVLGLLFIIFQARFVTVASAWDTFIWPLGFTLLFLVPMWLFFAHFFPKLFGRYLEYKNSRESAGDVDPDLKLEAKMRRFDTFRSGFLIAMALLIWFFVVAIPAEFTFQAGPFLQTFSFEVIFFGMEVLLAIWVGSGILVWLIDKLFFSRIFPWSLTKQYEDYQKRYQDLLNLGGVDPMALNEIGSLLTLTQEYIQKGYIPITRLHLVRIRRELSRLDPTLPAGKGRDYVFGVGLPMLALVGSAVAVHFMSPGLAVWAYLSVIPALAGIAYFFFTRRSETFRRQLMPYDEFGAIFDSGTPPTGPPNADDLRSLQQLTGRLRAGGILLTVVTAVILLTVFDVFPWGMIGNLFSGVELGGMFSGKLNPWLISGASVSLLIVIGAAAFRIAPARSRMGWTATVMILSAVAVVTAWFVLVPEYRAVAAYGLAALFGNGMGNWVHWTIAGVGLAALLAFIFAYRSLMSRRGVNAGRHKKTSRAVPIFIGVALALGVFMIIMGATSGFETIANFFSDPSGVIGGAAGDPSAGPGTAGPGIATQPGVDPSAAAPSASAPGSAAPSVTPTPSSTPAAPGAGIQGGEGGGISFWPILIFGGGGALAVVLAIVFVIRGASSRRRSRALDEEAFRIFFDGQPDLGRRGDLPGVRRAAPGAGVMDTDARVTEDLTESLGGLAAPATVGPSAGGSPFAGATASLPAAAPVAEETAARTTPFAGAVPSAPAATDEHGTRTSPFAGAVPSAAPVTEDPARDRGAHQKDASSVADLTGRWRTLGGNRRGRPSQWNRNTFPEREAMAMQANIQAAWLIIQGYEELLDDVLTALQEDPDNKDLRQLRDDGIRELKAAYEPEGILGGIPATMLAKLRADGVNPDGMTRALEALDDRLARVNTAAADPDAWLGRPAFQQGLPIFAANQPFGGTSLFLQGLFPPHFYNRHGFWIEQAVSYAFGGIVWTAVNASQGFSVAPESLFGYGLVPAWLFFVLLHLNKYLFQKAPPAEKMDARLARFNFTVSLLIAVTALALAAVPLIASLALSSAPVGQSAAVYALIPAAVAVLMLHRRVNRRLEKVTPRVGFTGQADDLVSADRRAVVKALQSQLSDMGLPRFTQIFSRDPASMEVQIDVDLAQAGLRLDLILNGDSPESIQGLLAALPPIERNNLLRSRRYAKSSDEMKAELEAALAALQTGARESLDTLSGDKKSTQKAVAAARDTGLFIGLYAGSEDPVSAGRHYISGLNAVLSAAVFQDMKSAAKIMEIYRTSFELGRRAPLFSWKNGKWMNRLTSEPGKTRIPVLPLTASAEQRAKALALAREMAGDLQPGQRILVLADDEQYVAEARARLQLPASAFTHRPLTLAKGGVATADPGAEETYFLDENSFLDSQPMGDEVTRRQLEAGMRDGEIEFPILSDTLDLSRVTLYKQAFLIVVRLGPVVAVLKSDLLPYLNGLKQALISA